ncbi:Rid family detoxifying hydrolase [Liquorilactobacillus aquaticus]|nr:Rid family detoxifying hydrolase [Liquorilactobacillus aquaticus]
MTERIQTNQAPNALGAYSQAIKIENTLYCSGQIGIDPVSGKIKSSEVSLQTKQTLKNLKAVIDAAGFCIGNIVKVTIFMTNIHDFQKVNDVYNAFFKESNYYPARSTVNVAALPADAKIEVEAICQK